MEKYVSSACAACRQRKLKCDDHQPQCTPCQRASRPCIRDSQDGRRRGVRDRRVNQLHEQIKQLKSSLSLAEQDAYGSSSATSTSPQEGGESSNQSSAAFAGLDAEAQNTAQLYVESDLRACTTTFVQTLGSVFFIATTDHIDALFDCVYRPPERVLPITILELHAIVLLGKDLMESPPHALRDATFFDHPEMSFLDCVEQYPEPALRILACITLTKMIENVAASRRFIAMGVELANCLFAENEGVGDQQDCYWLMNTFIAIGCWLDFATMFSRHHLNSRSELPETAPMVQELSIDQRIQSSFRLSCEILATGLRQIRDTANVRHQLVEHNLTRMHHLHSALPAEMQLWNMTAGQPDYLTIGQYNAVLMLHLIFMGGRILLQMPLVLSVADKADMHASGVYTLDDSARSQYRSCFEAAQTSAEVCQLLLRTPNVRRCLIVIHQGYCAAVTLMYESWLNLLNEDWEAMQSSIAHLHCCIKVLVLSNTVHQVCNIYLAEIRTEVMALKAELELKSISLQPPGPVQVGLQALVELLAADNLLHPPQGSFLTRMTSMVMRACGGEYVFPSP